MNYVCNHELAVVIADPVRELKLVQGLFFDSFLEFQQAMRDLLSVFETFPEHVHVFIPTECEFPIHGIWPLYQIIGN